MNSRLILALIFWVMLVMAVITVSVPEALRGGGFWEVAAGYLQDMLANDVQKKDMTIQRSKKIVKNYIEMLKELYGTRFLMAENTADLAQRYAELMRAQKQDKAGATSVVMNGYVDQVQTQSMALRGRDGEEAVELTDDMINNFKKLEQRVRERRSGREVYQGQLDKIVLLRNIYARGLEKAAAQREKIRDLHDKIRMLNERISVANYLNADKERAAALEQQLMMRSQATQEKVRELRAELEAIYERQAAQKERIDALRERMNSRIGR
jgi:hypothetical protein